MGGNPTKTLFQVIDQNGTIIHQFPMYVSYCVDEYIFTTGEDSNSPEISCSCGKKHSFDFVLNTVKFEKTKEKNQNTFGVNLENIYEILDLRRTGNNDYRRYKKITIIVENFNGKHILDSKALRGMNHVRVCSCKKNSGTERLLDTHCYSNEHHIDPTLGIVYTRIIPSRLTVVMELNNPFFS